MSIKPINLWIRGFERLDDGRWVLQDLELRTSSGSPNEWMSRNILGPATFLRGFEVTTRPVQLGLVHFSRGGWRWVLSCESTPPQPPFLLTDELQTRAVFSGRIAFRCSEVMEEMIRDADPGEEWCVRCESWFGILRPDVDSSPLRGSLRAFSTVPSAAVVVSQRLEPDEPDEWVEVVDILDADIGPFTE